MKRLELVLQEFAKRNQVEQPQLNQRGYFVLTFDEQFEVCLSENFDYVFFHSNLGLVPEQKETAATFLKDLMHYSTGRMLKQDSIISMNEEGNICLFKRSVIKNMTVQQFEDELEIYVNTLEEYWKTINGLSNKRSVSVASRPNILKP